MVFRWVHFPPYVSPASCLSIRATGGCRLAAADADQLSWLSWLCTSPARSSRTPRALQRQILQVSSIAQHRPPSSPPQWHSAATPARHSHHGRLQRSVSASASVVIGPPSPCQCHSRPTLLLHTPSCPPRRPHPPRPTRKYTALIRLMLLIGIHASHAAIDAAINDHRAPLVRLFLLPFCAPHPRSKAQVSLDAPSRAAQTSGVRARPRSKLQPSPARSQSPDSPV